MDIDQLLMDSLFQFKGEAIKSVADLKAKAEGLFIESKAIIDSNKRLPITFYIYTNSGETMRFVPNLPKPLIAPVLEQVCKSAPEATALIAVTEAWGLVADDNDDSVELGSDEMREWIRSGKQVRDHPEARDILVITSLCNIGGHGKWSSMGTAPVIESGSNRSCGEILWSHGLADAKGTLLPPIEDILMVIEDPNFLREKLEQPQPGKFNKASSGW